MKRIFVSANELSLDNGSDMGEPLSVSADTVAAANRGEIFAELRRAVRSAWGEEIVLLTHGDNGEPVAIAQE